MTESSFIKVFLPLGESVYRVAFHILENEEKAKDTVQEVFLRLWKNRDSLDGILNPKAYVLMMTRNLCLDSLRDRKTVPLESGSALDKEQFPSAEEVFTGKERLEGILAAVKSLPEKQRMVLTLRTIEGLSYEEISKRTGMSGLTSRVLLSRARNTLRKFRK